MAKDIWLEFDTTYMTGDIVLNNGDLVRDNGLETAIMISLFTDRRASEYDDLDDVNDKRGWWGDQISSYPNDEIGSKLWLLDRAKTTDENIEKAKEYAIDALTWLVEDSVAQNVDVNAERQGTVGNERLALEILVYKFDDTIETFKFDDVWEAQFA